MDRRLITAIIAFTFLIESAGVEFSSPVARTKESTLRPMAGAVSDKMIATIEQFPSEAQRRLWHARLWKALRKAGKLKIVEGHYVIKDLPTLLSIKSRFFRLENKEYKLSPIPGRYTEAADNQLIQKPENSYWHHFILYNLGFITDELWKEYEEHMSSLKAKAEEKQRLQTGEIRWFSPEWVQQLKKVLQKEHLLDKNGKIKDLDSFLAVDAPFFDTRGGRDGIRHIYRALRVARGDGIVDILEEISLHVFILDELGFIDADCCIRFWQEAVDREDIENALELSDIVKNLYEEQSRILYAKVAIVRKLHHRTRMLITNRDRLKPAFMDSIGMLYKIWQRFLEDGAYYKFEDFIDSIEKRIRFIEEIIERFKTVYGEEIMRKLPYRLMLEYFRKIKAQHFTIKRFLDYGQIDTEDVLSMQRAIREAEQAYKKIKTEPTQTKKAKGKLKEKPEGGKDRAGKKRLKVSREDIVDASIYYDAFYTAMTLLKKLESPIGRQLVTEEEVRDALEDLRPLQKNPDILDVLESLDGFKGTPGIKIKDELDCIKGELDSVIAVLEVLLRTGLPASGKPYPDKAKIESIEKAISGSA